MTGFGFIAGTILMSTLFVFDLYVTKYCRTTYWGRTMHAYNEVECNHFGIYIVLWQWISGFTNSGAVNGLQYGFAVLFWVWFVLLFILSTHFYYKNEIYKLKEGK